MTRVRRSAATLMFRADGMRIYTVRPRKLVFYDAESDLDTAWLGAEDPCDLHDWR